MRRNNTKTRPAATAGSSESCSCSRSICCAETIERKSTKGKNKVGKSCSPRFSTVYGVFRVGVAVALLLLAAMLTLIPQLYIFYAYGKGDERSKEKDTDVNQRLSSEATILLSATQDQILLLNESLILPQANVTMQEASIAPVSSVDRDMEKWLAENKIVGKKDVRITVLFMSDQPLELDNSDTSSTGGTICKEVTVDELLRQRTLSRDILPQRAMLVSFGAVRRDSESKVVVELVLHSPSASKFSKRLPNVFNLEALDPFTWGNNRLPTEEEVENFHGTAVCLQEGSPLQVVKGWPIRIPGALIRHQLLNKSCKLRREKEKSQVELLCEDVDAKLALLKDMVEERPALREVFKKTGMLAGLSAAAFGIATVLYVLGSLSKSLKVFDVPTCLWVGSATGIASLLYAAVAGPIVAIKRFKWRRNFAFRKWKFFKKILKKEESLPSSTAAAVDLVLVVNELEHESNEVPDPSQLGIDAEIRPDISLMEGSQNVSPLAEKVQHFVNRYIYLDTIRPVLQRYKARGFTRFKQREDEEESELERLQNFLRRVGRINSQLLSVDDSGDFTFNAQQKQRAYLYIGEQLQQEIARNLDNIDKPFVAVEALYSKEKADCMLKKMKQLYRDVKDAGGDPLLIDATKPLLATLKKRLRQVKESEAFIDAELLRLEAKTGGHMPSPKEGEMSAIKQELLRAKAAAKEAAEVLTLELRVSYENDLQLVLEEADNLKEALGSLKKAAGEKPSPQPKAEIQHTIGKIAKLNKTAVSIIYEMRALGLEIDASCYVPVEVEAEVEAI